MEHKNNFNLMRLLFSIMVIYSHSFGLLVLTEPTILGRTFGNFAVHCFFALSGYLITISFIKSKNVIDFGYKRLLRLLPAYIIALFLGKILAPLCNKFIDNPVPYIINGTVWTLSYEILAYILVGIIGYFGLINSTSLGAFWLASWIVIIMNFSNPSPTYQVIIPMLFLFLSGSFIAVNEDKLKLKSVGIISVLLLIIIELKPLLPSKIISYLPWLYGANFTASTINYFIYLLILPIAIIYIGKYIPFSLNIKNDISYGLYIYAWIFQQTIIYIFMKKQIHYSPYLLFISSLIISSIFSFVSWKIIEYPSLSLKRFKISDLLNKGIKKVQIHISSSNR